MPNLKAMAVTATSISITTTEGNTFSITRAQVVAHFQTETGTRQQKKAATRTWLKDQVEASLGVHRLRADKIDIDFDDTTGDILSVEVRA